MTTTDRYQALLARVSKQVTAGDDPDGMPVRQALLLAEHAGLRCADGDNGEDWGFFATRIGQAVQDLQADLSEPAVLRAGLPDPGADSAGLRQDVAAVVRRLADLYTAAATTAIWPARRRLVWVRVALLLDEAAAQL